MEKINIFTDFKIKNIHIKNRIVLPPMVRFSLVKDDGYVTQDLIDWYGMIARSGVGLIIVEASAIEESGKLRENQIGIWNDSFIEGLTKVANEIHKYDVPCMIQIHHAGFKDKIVEVPEEDFEDDDFEDEEAGEADYEETVDQLEEAARVTKEYLEGIAKTYGAEATVTVEARRDRMTFVFDTDKQGLLIGKHGKILNALQVLAQVSVHRFIKGRISVQVDVGDYRQRRSETLQQIAERTARKVLKTKQPVYLEPLPAYERKQIHAALSKNKRISTHSEGKEPHRYLVVEIAE